MCVCVCSGYKTSDIYVIYYNLHIFSIFQYSTSTRFRNSLIIQENVRVLAGRILTLSTMFHILDELFRLDRKLVYAEFLPQDVASFK